MVSHVEIKAHVYTDSYYRLRIGVDGADPWIVPACAVLMKSDEYIKNWCYTRGNVVLVTRALKIFYVAEIKVFKAWSVCCNVVTKQTQKHHCYVFAMFTQIYIGVNA